MFSSSSCNLSESSRAARMSSARWLVRSPSPLFPFSPFRPDGRDALSHLVCGCVALRALMGEDSCRQARVLQACAAHQPGPRHLARRSSSPTSGVWLFASTVVISVVFVLRFRPKKVRPGGVRIQPSRDTMPRALSITSDGRKPSPVRARLVKRSGSRLRTRARAAVDTNATHPAPNCEEARLTC